VNVPAPLKGFRAAFVFLTRLPVGGAPYSDADWRWSAAHFPLVGGLVGAAVGWVDATLQPLGPWAAAILALTASLMITGALHEDGFADTCDALGGAHSREKVFAILKDSRIGVYGGCALVVSIGARAALLPRFGAGAAAGLVLAGAMGRLAAVWQLATMRYVTDAAVAKSAGVAGAGPVQAIVATVFTAAIGTALVTTRQLAWETVGNAAVIAAFVTLATAWRYRVRAGGVTGDFLGATEQLCEIAVLAALAWR
jgi:adenosylcobinamide-GDP ribazoletransferase